MCTHFFSSFRYTLEYRKGYAKGYANGNADFLSRLPQRATEWDEIGQNHDLVGENGADADIVGVFFVRACGRE